MSVEYTMNIGLFGVPGDEALLTAKGDGQDGADIRAESGEMVTSVTVTAEAETEDEAKRICGAAADRLEAAYGQKVFTREYGTLWNTAVSECLKNGSTFALAESCTGGLISKMVTDVPGASGAFKLGVVAYHPEAKRDVLGVHEETLEKKGVVSAETAAEMAEGVRMRAGSSLGIGVTGFAGPGGGEKNEQGKVFISLSDGNTAYTRRIDLPGASRGAVRRAATLNALDMIRLYAQGHREGIGTPVQAPSVAGVVAGKAASKKKPPLYKRFIGFFTEFPKDPAKEKIRKLVLCAAIAVMCYAGFQLASGAYFYLANSMTEGHISNLINQGNDLTDDERNDLIGELEGEGVDVPDEIQNWALLLLKNNPDLVGRVQITTSDGSKLIDQVVVQGSDNEEYLKKDFFGNYNTMGCVFMDSRCDPAGESMNTIIYGHSTKRVDKIFNGLQQYKSLDFLNENPLITYSTLTEESVYKIFAVMIINTNEAQGETFSGCYYTGTSVFSNMEAIRDRSMYDTTVTVNAADKILTLSTCTFEMDDLRLVVMARKLREGESLEVEPASNNPDTVYFDAWYKEYDIDGPTTSGGTSSEGTTSGGASSGEVSSGEEGRFDLFDMSISCKAASSSGNRTSIKVYVPYITDFDFDCTVGIAEKPENGSISVLSSDNTVTYSPKVGFSGVDTFVLSLNDSSGFRYDTATVTVYVGVEQQTGVILNKESISLSVSAGATGTCRISASSVSGGDLQYILVEGEGLYSGTASVDETGKVTYTSTSDERWADTVKVAIVDETGSARVAVINVNSGRPFETDQHPETSRPDASEPEDEPASSTVSGSGTSSGSQTVVSDVTPEGTSSETETDPDETSSGTESGGETSVTVSEDQPEITSSVSSSDQAPEDTSSYQSTEPGASQASSVS